MKRADLGILLVSAVRYALGRRSYIVAVTCDLVRAYREAVPRKDMDVIRGDLERAFRDDARYSGTLGMPMDRDQWRRLADELGVVTAVSETT